MTCYPKKIDLHIHSKISDGTDTPSEILQKVKGLGIELFSITDHDAIKAAQIISRELRDDSPAFITGVEFSCRDENGKYHILGYSYDTSEKAVMDIVQKAHDYRMEKLTSRLNFLKSEFGITFPQNEIDTLLRQENPGKPHIGKLMVKCGFASTKEEAISEYLNKGDFIGRYVRPEEAINGILAGGGIPVLAHPSFGSGNQLITGAEMDKRLSRLTELGLQGAECFYSGFSRELINEMLDFAKKYDLYITAGSDYHGANKTVAFGHTNQPDVSDYPAGLIRFFRRVLADIK